MGKLDDKAGIVTGAARGIGRAHCLALATEGADVACLDICKDQPGVRYGMSTEEDLNSLVGEIKSLGRRAIAVECDVTKAIEVEAAVKKVVDEFGKIDILVNNAGICNIVPITEMTEAAWDTMMAVNLKGVFLCCKYVLPHMMKQESGKIINTSSVAGKIGQAYSTHYSTSKGGINTFTQALAKEVAPYNINVNAIGPGVVRTPLFRGCTPEFARTMGVPEEQVYSKLCELLQALGREITPEDIAKTMIFLVSEESRNVTGMVVYVDGGY